MNVITPSRSAYSATTTGLGEFFGLHRTPSPTTSPIHVVRVSPLPAQDTSSSIDDFIADLCAEDPRLEATIEEGTRWLGRTYFADVESIKALRLRAGLSQAMLAQRMGTSQPQVARLEKGEVDAGISTVARLADALDESPVRVFEILLKNFEKRHVKP